MVSAAFLKFVDHSLHNRNSRLRKSCALATLVEFAGHVKNMGACSPRRGTRSARSSLSL